MILDALRRQGHQGGGSTRSRPDAGAGVLSFQAIGVELDDLEISFANTDTGEVEVQLSEEGFRIVQAAACRLNVTPDELLRRALTLAVDPR